MALSRGSSFLPQLASAPLLPTDRGRSSPTVRDLRSRNSQALLPKLSSGPPYQRDGEETRVGKRTLPPLSAPRPEPIRVGDLAKDDAYAGDYDDNAASDVSDGDSDDVGCIPNATPTYGYSESLNTNEYQKAAELLKAIKSQKTSIYFDLLADLTMEQIVSLKKEFSKRPLSMCEFISVVESLIEETVLEKNLNTQMVLRQLMNLYEQIDTHSKGKVSWEKFSSFFMNHSSRAKTDTSDIPSDITRYQTHPNLIQLDAEVVDNIVYIPETQKIITCDKTKVARLRDTFRGYALRDITGHSAAVLNARFVKAKEMYVTSSADSTMVFYDSAFLKLCSIETEYPQLSLEWVNSIEGLCTGDTKGTLHLWDLDARQLVKKIPRAHDEWIMDFAFISDYSLMASASLDKTVRIWDMKTFQPVSIQRGHTLGVSCLAYSYFATLILSGGSERDIYVWHHSKKGVVQKMKGHEKSITGLISKEGSPEIISADVSGCIKIWDIRRFHCVQTLSVRSTSEDETEQSRITSMCYDAGRRKVVAMDKHINKAYCSQIITAGRRLQMWRPEMDRSNDITSNGLISCIRYLDHQAYKNFVVSSGNEVSVWDATQGTCEHNFHSSGEILSLMILERKVFVGTIKGCIEIYNISTGGMIGSIPTVENDEVIHVIDAGKKTIVIGTAKGKFLVYDISNLVEPRLKYSIAHEKKGLTCVACCPLNRLLYISLDNSIALYKLDNGAVVSKDTVIRIWSSGCLVRLLSVDIGAVIKQYEPTPNKQPRQGRRASRPFAQQSVGDSNLNMSRSTSNVNLAQITIANLAPESLLLVTDSLENEIYVWNINCLLHAISSLSLNGEPRLCHIIRARDSAVNGLGSQLQFNLPKYPPLDTKEVQIENPVDLLFHRVDRQTLDGMKMSSMAIMEEPFAIATGCSDGRVKLWTVEGRLLGRLAKNGDSLWNYSPDKASQGDGESSGFDEEESAPLSPVSKNRKRLGKNYHQKSEEERLKHLSTLSPFYTNLKTVLEEDHQVKPFYLMKKSFKYAQSPDKRSLAELISASSFADDIPARARSVSPNMQRSMMKKRTEQTQDSRPESGRRTPSHFFVSASEPRMRIRLGTPNS